MVSLVNILTKVTALDKKYNKIMFRYITKNIKNNSNIDSKRFRVFYFDVISVTFIKRFQK